MLETQFWNVRNYSFNILQRFWNKVQIEYLEDGSPNFEKCMIWIGSKNESGYGIFYYKKYVKAHRFIYECFNLDNIYGYLICHKCDNPSCVNPYHLFKGTITDNIHDCVQKDRNAKGEQQGAHILTNQDIYNILIDVYNKKYQNIDNLAENYNVNSGTIRRILCGMTWEKETTKILSEYDITLYDLRNMIMGKEKYKLTEPDVKIIKNMLKEGIISQADIARNFNVDPSTISMINIGKNWSHING